MTIDDTLVLLSILKAAYPNFYKGMKPKDADGIVNTWHMMFADEDPSVVTAADKALIESDEKGCPPHIGADKAKIRLIMQPPEMFEIAVWQIVSRAVSRTQMQHPEKQFDILPEDVKQTLGSARTLVEWGMIDEDVFNSVIQSNFLRSYRTIRERRREMERLPQDVRTLISGMSENLKQLED